MASKGERGAAFWRACLIAALVSTSLQYAVLMAPFFRQGSFSWELYVVPLFGPHLVPPALGAALLWIPRATRRRPLIRGVAAGLLFSICAVVVLALPLGFAVALLSGLTFKP